MSAPTPEWVVLQRVILPVDDNLDVVPLYVETDLDRGVSSTFEPESGEQSAAPNAAVGATQTSVRFPAAPAGERRRSAEVRAGRRVSFATYFNAFPASYWRRWTVVEDVTLRLRVSGPATVIVYRSTARGASNPVHTLNVDAGDPQDLAVTLPLSGFVDGGWYWFDLAAGASAATLHSAEWASEVVRQRRGTATIGITTFNRAEFLVELVRSLGAAGDVHDVIDEVLVVDQGTQRVADHPDYADAGKPLGERLRTIVQPNLGGSGGFARAMDETVRGGRSDYVLLLDDDVMIEPEGVLRAVTFADLARRPTLVGGHMFSLHDRSVLHAFGETVAPYRWWWGAAPHTRQRHDFGRRTLRHTPWLHRRVDVDYNGWWMCLIPVEVVREVGLSLPAFIKWDDAEYGLRAHEAGYPTVSMPGVAVWHVPWTDKNDALDWQAYFHVRNRLLAALLHTPYDRGGRVVFDSLEVQVQHLLSMQYSTAALRVLALEDLLAGPDRLHAELGTKLGQLRAIRAEYPDARGAADPEDFPPVRRRKPLGRGRELTGPRSKVGLLAKAAQAALWQLRPSAEQKRPAAAVPSQDAVWWLLATVDSALVSAPDGMSLSWYRRDAQTFRELAVRSARLHAQLVADWPRLQKQYRAAAATLTEPEQWRHTFGIAEAPPEQR